jgi:hypothetical protein
MPLPIPGKYESGAPPEVSEPVFFVGELLAGNMVSYCGVAIEVFLSVECPDIPAMGDRYQCMWIPESQQIMLIGKIA